MPDKVRAIRTTEVPRLRSYNGIGTTMLGLTRPDRHEYRFGTRWFTLFGMPVIPLERYYLRQGKTTTTYRGGGGSTTRTGYHFAATASLHGGEILRTYLYFWVLAPVMVLGVPVLLVANGDSLANSLPGKAGTLIALVFGALIAGATAAGVLLDRYKKRWAPLREADWS